MKYTLGDIEQLARAHLSPEDCGILGESLLHAFSEADIIALENDPAFLAEMNRRIDAIHNGTSTSYTIDEAKAKIHAHRK